jgi:hypothetical protein
MAIAEAPIQGLGLLDSILSDDVVRLSRLVSRR